VGSILPSLSLDHRHAESVLLFAIWILFEGDSCLARIMKLAFNDCFASLAVAFSGFLGGGKLLAVYSVLMHLPCLLEQFDHGETTVS